MPIFDHFSFIAPIYDRVIPLMNAERLVEELDLPVAGRLLDAGGGTGRVADALRNQASQVVVADLSVRMLREAQGKRGLQPVAAQTERLPFQGASFDRVVMVDALHHVYSQAQTAGELWRVVCPGGRIVIQELNLHTLPVRMIALGEKLALMRSHFLPPARISALFPYPGARTRIEQDGFNTWIIIEKLLD